MKKILLLIFLFFPTIAYADYSIENYKIDITVSNNGDLDVVEAFNLSGDYNGFERIINYRDIYSQYMSDKIFVVEKNLYNAKKIELLEIRSIDFNNDDVLKNSYIFTKDNDSKKGDYGTYSIIKSYNSETYKIYNPSIMNKDFYINYRIKKAVIAHNDIAEFIFNLFPENSDIIKNLDINIHVPNNKKVLDIFLHGIKYADINKDIQNISINLKNIKLQNNLNFRLIFDTDIVDTNKKTDINAYDIILNKEEELKKAYFFDDEYEKIKASVYDYVVKVEKTKNQEDYDVAIAEVKKLRNDDFKTQLLIKLMSISSKVERKIILTKLVFASIIILWIAGLLFIIYDCNKNIGKRFEYKLIISNIRPYNYNPAVLSYLMYRKVSKRSIIATIINLINKNQISFIKTKTGYKFVKNNVDDINKLEEKIIKLIFDDKDQITTNALKKKLSMEKSYSLRYYNILNEAIEEAMHEKFFNDQLFIKMLGIIYSVMGIIMGTFFLGKEAYLSPFVPIVLGLLFIPYFIILNTRSDKGIEHFYKWKSYKKNGADDLAYNIVLNKKFNCELYDIINDCINI